MVQIESFRRRQNKCDSKAEISFGEGRKHCEKRRKCWLPAFSPFPAMFSKAFSFRIVRTWGYVRKGSTQAIPGH